MPEEAASGAAALFDGVLSLAAGLVDEALER